LPFQPIPEFEDRLGFLRTFVKEFVIFLAVLPFIASLSSFSRESWKLWLLKVFPFKDRAVAYGKFLFPLSISAASLTPMAFAADLVFEITTSEWVIAATLPLILLALLTVYSTGSTIFFLRQAGKGFRKLELRKILPHKGYSLERELEEREKPLTNMASTEEIAVTSNVQFSPRQPLILINFTIVNKSNLEVVVDSLLYEIRVNVAGHPSESSRKKRIHFLKKAKIPARQAKAINSVA